MAQGYITPAEVAERWQVSQQRVTEWCRARRIAGAYQDGRRWYVPDTASRPVDGRTVIAVEYSSSPRANQAGERPLPLPVGVSSYEEAVSRYAYVDKTLLIKELLDTAAKVTLFLRPRRFGKTLNMDMLRCFFEMGREGGADLFRDKLIWTRGERYIAELGHYPVVFLTLKDAKSPTWAETSRYINGLIEHEVRRHAELAQSDRLDIAQARFIQRIHDGEAQEDDWKNSLALLTAALHAHHGVAPIVLIDEYDAPIQEGHARGYYDEVTTFMRAWFSEGLKDNPHLAFSVITGVMRVAQASLFSGMNNLIVNSPLSDSYAGCFGFTHEEVRELLALYGREDKYEEALAWYDGYRFGHLEVCNPWSIVTYLSEGCRPGAYWVSTANNALIGRLVAAADEDTLDRLRKLMQGETTTAYVDTAVAYPRIAGDPTFVFSLLLMAGYLRADAHESEDGLDYVCDLRIPNREIRSVYAREVMGSLIGADARSSAGLIRSALVKGDASELQRHLGKFLYRSVSYFDTASESFFHGLVVGICAVFDGWYQVRSNREAGLGRLDVALVPLRRTAPGIVIEVKAAASASVSEEGLEALAREALVQAQERDYAQAVRDAGGPRTLVVGMAFSGKQVNVCTEWTG